MQEIWQVILFLRTIPNNGFQQAVTCVDKYKSWTAPQEMLNFIQTHPVSDPSLNPDQFPPDGDVFMNAAHWERPGLAPTDKVMLGGKLPITLADIAGAIRDEYYVLVTQAYDDAVARHDPGLPAKDQIFSVEGIQWSPP